MKKSMFVIRYRWWIIITTLVIVLFSALQLFNIQINPDLESYLPDEMPARVNSKLISDVFGSDEMLLIVVESDDVLADKTLERIADLSDAFSQSDYFSTVFSVFEAKDIRSEEGAMVVDPVILFFPENEVEREQLRTNIMSNKLAYGLVVSEDFKYALIMLTSNKVANDSELMAHVREILDEYPGDEAVYITGQPLLRDDANRKIGRDIMVLLPLGLLVMFLTLWLSFRELKAILLPFTVVVFSIIVSVGLIPLMGWELSIIGVLIPIMMIAVANNYGVYYVARYQDLSNDQNLSMFKIVELSVQYLSRPVVFCGLTTIVGILGLVAHILLPARQMGVVSAIGITFALLVSLLFIPAVMSFMKKRVSKTPTKKTQARFFPRMLSFTGMNIVKHPKWLLVAFVLFFSISTLGLMKFKVAPDSNNILPKSHSFNKAVSIVDDNFGGSKVLQVMIEGDVKDPELLNRILEAEEQIKSLDNVGSVASLATILIEISKSLNDPGDRLYGRIPDTREAVSQYLELYSMSSDPEEIERFVDFDYTSTLVTVQFQASTNAEVDMVFNKVEDTLGNYAGINVVAGGHALVEKEMSRSVLVGQYYSLLFALVAIIILLAIIFRSVIAGLLGSIPLIFAVFCTFGLMGWLGFELNIVTALLSSISIGLGVDFTIHIFWRIKWELQQGNDYSAAIKNSLMTIGRGISINAFSVMAGFSVVFISAFPLIRAFAFLIIISLFLCLISALVLIPVLVLLLKPTFLSKVFD